VSVSPDIEVMSREMRRRMYHQRSFRAWKRNRDFEPQKHGRHRWQVRSGIMNDEIQQVLQAPDSFLARAALKFKKGRSSMVAAGDSVVLKRYNFKKPFNLVKDLFRPSRALASFRKAYHLELSGIPTARPLAAADRRVSGLVTGGYFLMERIPSAVSLRDYRSDAALVVRKVASLIAKLHEEGFSHRDLKTSNIMFDQNDRPVLIDLDGLSYEGAISNQRAQTDLRRLLAAARRHPQWKPTFATRFLRNYCRQRNLRPKLFLGRP
jgi:tRNA A-37 threonylcarbamoyl transferase component Bud32